MSTTAMYNEIQAGLKRGERIAVATVVKTIGAAPCGVGTKMLVRADGTTSGGFSGAKVDTQVAQEAVKALRESRSYKLAWVQYSVFSVQCSVKQKELSQ